MNEQIAIMRLCVRCKELRSIDDYAPNGKICKPCCTFRPYTAVKFTGVTRGLVLTEKGKQMLTEMAAEEVTAA